LNSFQSVTLTYAVTFSVSDSISQQSHSMGSQPNMSAKFDLGELVKWEVSAVTSYCMPSGTDPASLPLP
jgi:hypothetical protein